MYKCTNTHQDKHANAHICKHTNTCSVVCSLFSFFFLLCHGRRAGEGKEGNKESAENENRIPANMHAPKLGSHTCATWLHVEPLHVLVMGTTPLLYTRVARKNRHCTNWTVETHLERARAETGGTDQNYNALLSGTGMRSQFWSMHVFRAARKNFERAYFGACMSAARKNFERAVGQPRPEPGLLTPGSRPPPRTALVCSLPAHGALNSRVLLRIPIGSVDVGTARCARHRHALRTRVSAPQARAQCLLACLASSCSAISATAVQPSSAAHCGIGRREPLRASTQIAYTRAHCLLDCCHWVASHCTAPRFICRSPSRPQKQKLRGRSETS